jgi:hypothetical protein
MPVCSPHRGPEGPWRGRIPLQVPKGLTETRRARPRSRMGHGSRSGSSRQLRRAAASAQTGVDDRRVNALAVPAAHLRRDDRDAGASSASIAPASPGLDVRLRETRRRATWVRQRSHILRGERGVDVGALRRASRRRLPPRSEPVGPSSGGQTSDIPKDAGALLPNLSEILVSRTPKDPRALLPSSPESRPRGPRRTLAPCSRARPDAGPQHPEGRWRHAPEPLRPEAPRLSPARRRLAPKGAAPPDPT